MRDGIVLVFGLVGLAGAFLFAGICILANHMFRQRGLPAEEETSDDL